MVVKAFAKHAAKLSLTHKIDARRWQRMLEYADQQDPRDHDVARAVIQLLIDQKKDEEALPYCEAFAKAHADNHSAKANSKTWSPLWPASRWLVSKGGLTVSTWIYTLILVRMHSKRPELISWMLNRQGRASVHRLCRFIVSRCEISQWFPAQFS